MPKSEIGYRKRCLAQKINVCANCGTNDDLIVHHINGDRDDNGLENLIPMCRGCHQRLHLAGDVTGRLADLRAQLPESSLRLSDGQPATERVGVTEETWEQLNQLKKPGDSFDDVLQRLLAEKDGGDEPGNPTAATGD